MIRTETPLQFLKGVGPKRAAALAAKGLETVEDLLYHLPFRYEDRRSFAPLSRLLTDDGEFTLEVEVASARDIPIRRRNFSIFEARVTDDSGSLRVVWYNQRYLKEYVQPGRRLVLYGRATTDRNGQRVLENPEWERLDEADSDRVHTARITPVYRKVANLGCRALRQMIFRALEQLDVTSVDELVPGELVRSQELMTRLDALREIHFPSAESALDELNARASLAHKTLAFEEIFLLQLALALRRRQLIDQGRGIAYEVPDALKTRMAQMLPFKLTDAQRRVVAEIGADLRSDHAMNRLLQGDVGSGKTVVALLTLLVAIENGYQAALMAPTEILAEQHDRTIRRLLERGAIETPTVLLTGSLKAARRRQVLEQVRTGEARLVIGTHALFEAGVEFERLGLVVVDEQHRFGVLQRAALARKGARPDVLVMTATPIPRSLAMTLYGDLDLSIIDELPPGRTPVRTVVRAESDRARVAEGVRREVARGRQAYFVVPLVEETAKSDLKAATAFAEHLARDVFSDCSVGMVHGRMKGPEKDAVMQRFAAGEIDVLVATTVIEVGVDVPNATIMVIEHAERFGLSQLHQLRGRVGRGEARSFCVLMVGRGEAGAAARERLAVMERTSDGFVVAERDLELRGPGAVFGTQQHGLSDLQFLAMILKVPGLLDQARAAAQAMIDRDPTSRQQAERLLASLRGKWKRRLELAQVG